MPHDDKSLGANTVESVVDLSVLRNCIRERVWNILVITLIGLFLGMVWAWRSGPLYEVNIIVVPTENEVGGAGTLIESAGLAGLIGLGPAGQVTRKDEAVATLTSRNFLYSFISDLQLLSVMFGSSEDKGWRPPFWPKKEPALADAYELFLSEVLVVTEKRRTGLIEVTVRWNDPEITAKWGHELISRLNKEMQSRARERALREMEFLQRELEKADSVQVRQAIFKLIETQMKTLMLTNVSDDFAFRVVDAPIVPDADKPVNLSFLAKTVVGAILALIIGFGYAVGCGLKFAVKK